MISRLAYARTCQVMFILCLSVSVCEACRDANLVEVGWSDKGNGRTCHWCRPYTYTGGDAMAATKRPPARGNHPQSAARQHDGRMLQLRQAINTSDAWSSSHKHRPIEVGKWIGMVPSRICQIRSDKRQIMKSGPDGDQKDLVARITWSL